MWIFTNKGMISVVRNRKSGGFLVRARKKEHLIAFGARAYYETKDADYRWRTTMGRMTFKTLMRLQVERIDYDNFKASIQDREYHDSCLRVWHTMKAYQGIVLYGRRMAHGDAQKAARGRRKTDRRVRKKAQR